MIQQKMCAPFPIDFDFASNCFDFGSSYHCFATAYTQRGCSIRKLHKMQISCLVFWPSRFRNSSMFVKSFRAPNKSIHNT